MYHKWGRGKVHTRFLWEDQTEGDRFEDPDVDGRIILQLVFNKWDWGMDWIDLGHNTDWWQALVNAAMNLRIS
jgi:hypothetical protein